MRWLETPNTGQFDSITNLEYKVFRIIPGVIIDPNPKIKQLDVVYSPNSLTIYRGDAKRDL